MQVKFTVFLLQAITMYQTRAGSFKTLPGPILSKYWTGSGAN